MSCGSSGQRDRAGSWANVDAGATRYSAVGEAGRGVGVMVLALGPSAMAEIDCIVQRASSTRASCTSGTVGMLNSRSKARRSIGRVHHSHHQQTEQ